MTRHKDVPQLEPAPYVKSPYQLEQWAAYEALTAQREQERQAATAASEAAKGLFADHGKWRQAELIREYVAKIMSLLPADASPAAVAAAREWRDWALELADERDPALAQVKVFLAAG